MSSASAISLTRRLAVLLLVSATGSLGCWEQWSDAWWPQMKWQPAVQAYEIVQHGNQLQGFTPPTDTVPIDGGEAPVSNVIDAAADQLKNPQPVTLASLENGRAQFTIYCRACHGPQGHGDGPVSMTGPIAGPFAAVLPVAGPGSIAKIRSDGHIYTTIRYGRRRMPSYRRIPPHDRWDIVNYLRYLNDQTQVAR